MVYKIIISRAQLEIENSIDFYTLYSIAAPKHFTESLSECYSYLSINPYSQRVRYKNIRALKLKRLPYSLYYTIEEETVRILSCFHNKRNPITKPEL